ncbi:MAG: MATE family efflux transporter [Ruminococcaceae bacterium]|nr:MATE family efflux transporter [Oscillospiraceae bacterium]
MNIKLSDHFTYKRIMRFTLPPILMMIFTSIYGVVDGYFVSNFAGKMPFAAVNLIMPFLMILGCIGFMFGAGGSALVAKTLGEGKEKKANEIFSLIVYVSLALSFLIAILGIIYIEPVSKMLGADNELLIGCVEYGTIILIALPAFVMQMEFQSFFITAEKPNLGLKVTLISGIINMVLDFLLVGVFPFGIKGAAIATAISQFVGGFLPIIYFARKNNSLLKLTKTKFDLKPIVKTCTNGSSELMSNISMSLVAMLYNGQLMKYEGENGVAAYGVLMYVSMIFAAIFIGYSIGSAPVVGYNYGAKNDKELKNILKLSVVIIGVFSVIMMVMSLLLAYPLSKLFVGYDKELFSLTLKGFNIFSFSYLFMGYAIFSSGFFTALNDGVTSAIISFLRTLVFQIAAVILLPMIWQVDGIWISIVVAELMAVVVSVVFIMLKRNKYKYY